MEIEQFDSFKELIEAAIKYKNPEILQIIDEIYNTSFTNEVWIGQIIDFLNDNDEEKCYNECYLTPFGSYGTRKYTYRFISTEEDKPSSRITDDDVQTLKKLKAQPQFILYDYEEDPALDIFGYYNLERTLKKCLESIGMTEELKVHLCEFCFSIIKRDRSIKNQESGPQLIKK